MNYNRVIIGGRLTRDPETRFTGGGTAVTSASLATNEKWKGGDGEWQERTTFIDVTIWGKRGEAFAKFHKKGDAAFLEGKLQLDQWEDKQGGGKRSKLFVVADSWEFVGGGKKSDGDSSSSGDGGWEPSGPGSDFGGDTPF